MPYKVTLERVDHYNPTPCSVREALQLDLKEASQYTQGQLEVLQTEHERLVTFVGNFVQLLAEANLLNSHIMSCLFPMYLMKTEEVRYVPPPPGIDDDEIPF